ncbi:nitric oxide reductase activation protein NorD [Nocardia mexicana]|uniref:von Willebrand factor type A domain-containing protein n=1 Tax=Nocardia mexicana TaxID=279262 RepID=A0A370HGH1_9NOCA|nr:VWA domain-containing protein [Nocardia mexicana]RDI56105.1 von Willebrand factor type A domain-containing protein [Nocardia mexicana]
MTAPDPNGPSRFRLLGTCIAGRAVDTAEAAAGEVAHTDGRVVFVSAGFPVGEQRRELLVQAALLAAGSLDRQWVKALRGRPALARRYLALEGHRALAELAGSLPLAAELRPGGVPRTTTAGESLEIAKGKTDVADPPDWFGVIKPSRLLEPAAGPGARATRKELRLEFDLIDIPETESDGDTEQSGASKILRLFENPLFNSRALSDYFRKLLGSSRSPGDGAAGAEMQVRAVRRVQEIGAHASPLPTPIRFTGDGRPGAAVGVGGALYPEWDVHGNGYRPDWCRVIDFPFTAAADISAAGVPHDDVLRRRLARIGLGPTVLRGRADGDELDIEALIDLFIDLRSGYSRPEHVYLEHRKLARDLGVLILLDASGSATDTDPDGLAVHDHQRRAAATLAVTLEELGDRVAVYAFRSNGRHAVELPAIKTFAQRFGAVGRARLNRLQPSGYTRLGAGIRGAGRILDAEGGTRNRLLVVLSDGFPYDDGYEGRYAEADANRALEELRADGIACLCLSLGAATSTAALERVFGAAGHARATTLAELSPRMDELFLSALRELSAPRAVR